MAVGCFMGRNQTDLQSYCSSVHYQAARGPHPLDGYNPMKLGILLGDHSLQVVLMQFPWDNWEKMDLHQRSTLSFKYALCRAWCVPVNPARRRLRHEDCGLSPAWATKHNPVSKVSQANKQPHFLQRRILPYRKQQWKHPPPKKKTTTITATTTKKLALNLKKTNDVERVRRANRTWEEMSCVLGHGLSCWRMRGKWYLS